MIKGMTVTLINLVDTGTRDSFNHPIYEEKQISVDNVLVAPASTQDVSNTVDLVTTKAVYTLGIPKGDTNEWKGQYVEFFGKRWRVAGDVIEGIETNIPLKWHKKVTVESYEQ